MEMILRGAEESETFFRDFEVAGTGFLPVVVIFSAHTCLLLLSGRRFRELIPENVLEL
jgi:hypothetical protein